jgi:hypothetical protein
VPIKYNNSANGDSCGILTEDSAVVFVTKYHKNIGKTGKGKSSTDLCRARRVSWWCIICGLPARFWRQINGAVREKAVDGGKYVWEPQPEKGWQMPDRKRGRIRGASSQKSNSSSSSKRARVSDRAGASVDPATSQDM